MTMKVTFKAVAAFYSLSNPTERIRVVGKDLAYFLFSLIGLPSLDILNHTLLMSLSCLYFLSHFKVQITVINPHQKMVSFPRALHCKCSSD